MAQLQKITPFLWFEGQANEAAHHYVSLFPDSRILSSSPLPSGPAEGAAIVSFVLAGQEFTVVDDAHYRVSMSVGVGMIRGDYSADVTLADMEQETSLRMLVVGKGSAGSIQGNGQLRLSASNGGTSVELDGDAQVTGVVARVGQRLLSSVSRKMMDQFFSCLKTQIDGA